LLRRGYRVDGAFLPKCGGSTHRPFAHPIAKHRGDGRWRCHGCAALPLLCFLRHIAAQVPLCLWATNNLINTSQDRYFAQAAVELCGSLEQRRDLGTCPTLTSLNAELVACRTSGSMALPPLCLRATSHRGSMNATILRSDAAVARRATSKTARRSF
jgi:hypothetical protein